MQSDLLLKENGEKTNYTSISDRVAGLDMKFGQKNLTLIQVYAPTYKAKESEIQLFYSEILKALQNSSTSTMIMGDFNEKIGQPTPKDKSSMGPWGFGDRNERDHRLVRGCVNIKTKVKKNRKKFCAPKRQLTPSENEFLKGMFPELLTKEKENLQKKLQKPD
ncbi:unnamed protein product [Parnassius apollo]|uniref:(apollo) hypothetical protein n=1 Tax=Parnassius apollo TaxID=110799 RepID=A0A8S3WYS6_PARAO|nr:unnamed protein product [Parnassius apollo]